MDENQLIRVQKTLEFIFFLPLFFFFFKMTFWNKILRIENILFKSIWVI